jgi:hypothetical protein
LPEATLASFFKNLGAAHIVTAPYNINHGFFATHQLTNYIINNALLYESL